MNKKIKYLVAPNPKDKKLTKEITGFDESFKIIKTKIIIEKERATLSCSFHNQSFTSNKNLY